LNEKNIDGNKETAPPLFSLWKTCIRAKLSKIKSGGHNVELTDAKIIDALRNGVQNRRRPRQPRSATLPDNRSERRKRCTCGTCTTCLDNARWEAIFNAKFADPDYYKARPVRSGSSLDWLRPRSNTNRSAER
jgi:hypothetical protein